MQSLDVAQSHGRLLGSLALGSPDARAGYSRTARQVAVLYLEVLIQQGRSIRVMDVPTCVQSPIIVQSHESEVRPGRILFPLLPLRIFGNTSADPSRCLADPLVAHEALLDLDMVAADGCRSLDVARKRGQHLGLRRIFAAASWASPSMRSLLERCDGDLHDPAE